MALETQPVIHPLGRIFAILAVSTAIMVALQAFPESWQHAIRYDRTAVGQGEVWRLLTGNFLHLGWSHLALNMAGLWLGTWLFGTDRSASRWLCATFVVAMASSVGLWLFSPSVTWCVGLSGALHGFMVIGFGGWALAGERYALLLLAIVIGKLTWEQLGGDMPWADAMAGGRVITDAHLWGAIGGAAFLAWEVAWKNRQARV